MKTSRLNNAVEIQDVDLYDDDQCREIGRFVAHECVAVLKQSVTEERLHAMQLLWGQPTKALLHRYVGERRLGGKHWRNLLVSLSRATKGVDHIAHADGMSRVSFQKDKRGNPTGLFTNGELDWHSDQQAIVDSQTIVGLMSLWGTENSQTTFLCTAPAYDALNHDDKSMADELTTIWEWDGGEMSEDLLPEQKEIVRYSGFPMPSMECPLIDQTATGRKGFRFPTHSFSHFKGMTAVESETVRKHLWSLINRPEYIYTHNWQDGEIVFMDQNITLHARPTNIVDGDNRTLSRMNTYLDNLFPDEGPLDYIDYQGTRYSHDAFASLADEYRRKEFYTKAPDTDFALVRV